jgi:CBS domain-containing protein
MTSVKEIMKKPVITVNSQQTVLDAAKLMKEKSLGCLVVMDGEKAIGITTERDFIRRVIAENLPYDTKISEVMSMPLTVVDVDAPLRVAARIMLEHKIRRLPVEKDGKLVGIIVASDFLRQLSKKTLTEQILDALARYPAIPYEI